MYKNLYWELRDELHKLNLQVINIGNSMFGLSDFAKADLESAFNKLKQIQLQVVKLQQKCEKIECKIKRVNYIVKKHVSKEYVDDIEVNETLTYSVWFKNKKHPHIFSYNDYLPCMKDLVSSKKYKNLQNE